MLCCLYCYSQSQKLGVRNAHAMVYHKKAKKVFLFGGADEKEVKSDFWKLKGEKWKQVKANGPTARTFPAMVYDEKNDRIILFGGNRVLFGKSTSADNLLNDTWEFKNKKWRKIAMETKPSPRAEASMVYDPVRGKVYLFGGYYIDGEAYIKLGDTWELDGNNWRQIDAEGPSARHGVLLSFEGNLQQILLFGGSTVNRDYGEDTGESWTFDGTKWTKLPIHQPANIFNSSGTFGNGIILRFGGWNGEGRINESWAFRDSQWEQMTLSPAPEARNHSGLVWDEKNDRFVLYGGHDGKNIFGDTWVFRGNEWHLLLDQPMLERVGNGH